MSLVLKLKRKASNFLKDVEYRIKYGNGAQSSTVDQFHKMYYERAHQGQTWKSTSWLGVPVQKCPFDLWTYQEILYQIRPDLIIETGTLMGGSAYYLGTLLDLLKKGQLITIDVDTKEKTLSKEPHVPEMVRPAHPRVQYWLGSSTSPEIVERLKNLIQPEWTVLVILDSDHSHQHVLNEMKTYAPLVTVGSYMVVEDSNINGHPVYPHFGPGPMEAINDFLKENTEFSVDPIEKKHMFTFNPKGFLKKIR